MAPDAQKVLAAMAGDADNAAANTTNEAGAVNAAAAAGIVAAATGAAAVAGADGGDLLLRPSIPDWFAGKSILVSGATGFMGKVLVEKLLRDCPLLERMYLLVRRKKGVEPEQRRDEYINHMIFDNIRASGNAAQLQKIRIVKGDVTIDDLGMDARDRDELAARVNIVFHCAANVRFDQCLKEAVNMNTLGTQRMLLLAEQMHDLNVFVHVSTAYCQCNEEVLEERGYPAQHRPLGIAKMTELLDSELIDHLTPKLLQGLPNTYAYTKGLTEALVAEYDQRLPIIIARPSIVTASLREPFPGWIEGLNGPTGLIIAAARGVARTMHCNPDYKADVIPVDVAINAIIAAAWDRGLRPDKTVRYCNVAMSQDKQMTWGQSIEAGKQIFYKNPLCFALWYPDGTIKTNYYHHSLCVLFYHYLPAYFIDALCVLMRRKPFLVNVQKRISQGLKVLQYYTTKPWVFRNDNLLRMESMLNKEDSQKFPFNIDNVDQTEYINNYILGARHFLLKEKPETLPAARALLFKLYLLDRFVSLLFWGLALWVFWSNLENILYGCETMFEGTRNLLSHRSSTMMKNSI